MKQNIKSKVFNSKSIKKKKYAVGGELDPTSEFWGIDNQQYTPAYNAAVNKIINDPIESKKAIEALKGTGYISSTEDITKFAHDKKIGDVHRYIQQLADNTPPSAPVYIKNDSLEYRVKPGVFKTTNTTNFAKQYKTNIAAKIKAGNTPNQALTDEYLTRGAQYIGKSKLPPILQDANGNDITSPEYLQQKTAYDSYLKTKKSKFAEGGKTNNSEFDLNKYLFVPNKIEQNIINNNPDYPQKIAIKDTRKIRATTGKPMVDTRDYKTESYSGKDIYNLIKSTDDFNKNTDYDSNTYFKKHNIDKSTIVAQALAETGIGKTDSNLGHVVNMLGENAADAMVYKVNEKITDANRLKLTNEVDILQIYNGNKHLTPKTESKYHQSIGKGSTQSAFYGVPIPKEGFIDTKKNPLYGKEVIDLRNNVINKNQDIQNMIDTVGVKQPIDIMGKRINKFNKEPFKPHFFAGGDTLSTGLKAGAGVASLFPGVGTAIGAGLGLASMVTDYFNNGDKEQETVDAQNKITAQNEAIQMKQRTDTEAINQRNYGSNTQLNSFYKQGGNMKPQFANDGQQLQPLAEDGVAVNGKSHEQGGVDYGDIEVEKGETIKKESDGDFVFSTEFKPDGKHDAGNISKSLFQKKQILQQQSGLIAEDIDRQQQSLKTSPSMINSNTKGREVSRGQFKQNNLESQIQQTDTAIEMLKQAQIKWGQEKGIYDEQGNNLVADQPLNDQNQVDTQQQEPMAKQGGNFKPQMAGGGRFVNGIWVEDNNNVGGLLNKNNINSAPSNTFDPYIDVTGLPNDHSTIAYSTTNTKPKVATSKPGIFSENNISTGLDVASTIANFASNQQTANKMAQIKTPAYIPVQSVKTGRINMNADKNAITQQSQGYNTWAQNNMANPQQSAIMRQSMQNQTQQQLDKVNQYESNANVGVEEQNATRNLQTQQINNQGFQNYQQQLNNKTISDIQNQSNVTGTLLKDVREGLANRERMTQQDRMYELYKLKYQNTPGVGRDISNAMDDTKLTLAQWKELQKQNNGSTFKKGGKMKPKYIVK